MSRLRILQYPLIERARGMEHYTAAHWKYMNHMDYICDFVTLHPSIAQDPLFYEDGARIFYIPYSHQAHKDIPVYMGKILTETSYDVLHLHLRYWTERDFSVLTLALQIEIPRILLHSHCAGVDQAHLAKHKEIVKRLQSIAANKVILCACTQEAAECMFGAIARKQHVNILKNAIDLERFSFSQEQRSLILSRNPFIQGKRCIITIGRIDAPQKRIAFAEKVIRFVTQQHPVYWMIFGESQDPLIGSICTDLVQGEHYGHMPAVWYIQDMMSFADGLLCTSQFEGVPRAVLEAQANGLPCLIPDTISSDVICSKLVHQMPIGKSPKQWAEHLWELVATPRADRTAALPALRAAGYDVQQAVRILEKLYSEGEI